MAKPHRMHRHRHNRQEILQELLNFSSGSSDEDSLVHAAPRPSNHTKQKEKIKDAEGKENARKLHKKTCKGGCRTTEMAGATNFSGVCNTNLPAEKEKRERVAKDKPVHFKPKSTGRISLQNVTLADLDISFDLLESSDEGGEKAEKGKTELFCQGEKPQHIETKTAMHEGEKEQAHKQVSKTTEVKALINSVGFFAGSDNKSSQLSIDSIESPCVSKSVESPLNDPKDCVPVKACTTVANVCSTLTSFKYSSCSQHRNVSVIRSAQSWSGSISVDFSPSEESLLPLSESTRLDCPETDAPPQEDFGHLAAHHKPSKLRLGNLSHEDLNISYQGNMTLKQISSVKSHSEDGKKDNFMERKPASSLLVPEMSESESQFMTCLSTPGTSSLYETVDSSVQRSVGIDTAGSASIKESQAFCSQNSSDQPDAEDLSNNTNTSNSTNTETDDVFCGEQLEQGTKEEESDDNHKTKDHHCHTDLNPGIDANTGDVSGEQTTADGCESETSGKPVFWREKGERRDYRQQQISNSNATSIDSSSFRKQGKTGSTHLDSSSEEDGDQKLEAFLQRVRTPARSHKDVSCEDDDLDDFIVADSDATDSDEDFCHVDVKLTGECDDLLGSGNGGPTTASREKEAEAELSWDVTTDTSSSESEDSSADDHGQQDRRAGLSTPKPKSLPKNAKTNETSSPKWFTPATSVKTRRGQDVDAGEKGRVAAQRTPAPLASRGANRVKARPYSFLRSLSTQTPDHLRDEEARSFIVQFKKRQEALSSHLFKLFNFTVFENKLPADMPVVWNKRLLKTAGLCKQKRVDCNYTVVIELSNKVCDTAERVRDTLVHEMCHAAVWILNKAKEGHGPHWKYWASKANRAHPEIPVIRRCHDYSISTKYIYKCVKCGYQIGRHSKSLDTEKKVCGKCRGCFQLQAPNSRHTSTTSVPATPRTPNPFAMFVKENYGSIKKKGGGLAHKDVMDTLSKEFAKTKLTFT